MPFFSRRPLFFTAYLLLGLLLAVYLTGNDSYADDTPEPVDKVMQKLLDEEYIPYADNNSCGDEDIDEDDLPDNHTEQAYDNARMAFLFGQFEVAFAAWQPLADEGYAKAQAALAWMYHTGNGVPKNVGIAFTWYLKAAKQGHAIAQNNLAAMYEDGLGTAVNYKAAARWYRESADAGYSFAQYNLGRLYAEGLGLKQDLDEARYWWRIAARQGVKKATETLALLENQSMPMAEESKPPAVAHAPYHANPVAKGLAWIKEQQNSHYTIQLAKNSDMDGILKLAASAQLEQSMVKFTATDSGGKEWHYLIYGSFPSFQKAEQARRVLPSSFRKGSPTLRRFSEIKQLLQK
ncbi:MAG: SPOR domain-containing protein [Gammaproteobacteria bacterium]|nr:SPOR domain-containing protein [Gammaproteobacteria bacterium]